MPERSPSTATPSTPSKGGTATGVHPEFTFQGACLYVPAVHPRVEGIVDGSSLPGLRVAVICLEDALAERDVPAGLAVLETIANRPATAGRRLYVRPRNPEMLARIHRSPDRRCWTGYALPKFGLKDAEHWLSRLDVGQARLMPILETGDVFCPSKLRDLCDILTAESVRPRIDAVRIGATDLFGVLGSRRSPHGMLYDSLLGRHLASVACYLMSRGLPVAGPVCETLAPTPAMEKEICLEVEAGFIGKTAVHPSQVPAINQAYQVTLSELDEAKACLESDGGVFGSRGLLCEPTPHRAWARRVTLRHAAFGLRESDGQNSRRVDYGEDNHLLRS